MRFIGILFAVIAACVLFGCNEAPMDIEKLKTELKQVDLDFSAMSVEQGMKAAFDYYMDDNAVMYRPQAQVFQGREAILPLFPAGTEHKLEWEPTFADVAQSGDIGYTLGKYVYSYTNEKGELQQSTGHYVTIWKKQADGSWKYVFDTGN
ncbi:MAG: DUF4440 domain-containing protein [Candidatus Zixiibacteriota bacterium]